MICGGSFNQCPKIYESAISRIVVSPIKRAAYFLSRVAIGGTVPFMQDLSLSITNGKYRY